MFLRKSMVGGRAYYTIAESYRTGDRVKQRTVRQLGRLNDDEANKWNLILRTEPHDVGRWVLDTSGMTTLHSYRHGTVALAHAMWKRLGMDSAVYDAAVRMSAYNILEQPPFNCVPPLPQCIHCTVEHVLMQTSGVDAEYEREGCSGHPFEHGELAARVVDAVDDHRLDEFCTD